MLQRQPQQEFLKSTAFFRAVFVDGFARVFKQVAVIDSRRTGRFAGSAAETKINVTGERLRLNVQLAFGDGAHQINASARAVVFVADLLIGRASGQTQAAMNAAQNLVHLSVESSVK